MSKLKTTYNHDYTVPELVPPKRYKEWTRVKERPEKALKTKPYEPKFINTMQPWHKNEKVQFDLHWEVKPIIRTHPEQTFEKTLRDKDPLKEEAIRTRPRLYMTPAVSMDDITDPEIRNLLIRSIYTTEWRRASDVLEHTFLEREIPNTTLEKSANPVVDKYMIYKRLPLSWKEKGKDWETKQETSLVDPTKTFWLNYKHKLNIPAGQDPFESTISDETRQKIRNLIDADQLRFAYDKPIPGYAGYISRNVRGPLGKQQ